MLMGFSESAFLHQNTTQVMRLDLRIVSKASTGTTFVHVLRLRKRGTRKHRDEPYREHYVSGYAKAGNKVGGVSIAGT